MTTAANVAACPRCNGECVVAGPQICPACNGTGHAIVTNIRPRGAPNYFAPLAKCGRGYPPPKTDHVDLRGETQRGARRYVLTVVRGARIFEERISVDEVRQLRDAANVLLAMEEV